MRVASRGLRHLGICLRPYETLESSLPINFHKIAVNVRTIVILANGEGLLFRCGSAVCSCVCTSHMHSPPALQARVLGQWSLVT